MTEPLRQETMEVIERSPQTIAAACQEVGIGRSSFYRWRQRLGGNVSSKRQAWNRLRESERAAILQKAKDKPELSARELAFWLVDHVSVFRKPVCDGFCGPMACCPDGHRN